MAADNNDESSGTARLRLIPGAGPDRTCSKWDDFVARQSRDGKPWLKAAVAGSRRPDVVGTTSAGWSLDDVARRLGIASHIIRYWEAEFPLLSPRRNKLGQRVYNESDVRIAFRIWELLHEERLTLADVHDCL